MSNLIKKDSLESSRSCTCSVDSTIASSVGEKLKKLTDDKKLDFEAKKSTKIPWEAIAEYLSLK